ncbi:flagellar protein FlgN [Crassaminicella profunda]|uniref:flagellar protein FlgN n=1 Tax=Crassaminicella profunda TaxID=1286698 RepID=UPI001CA6DA06|nr:flagellar protein FlgN [Crassaminicella profunda]QZY54321.1 flagellar protein FlgN [Crassaminicella profunda]
MSKSIEQLILALNKECEIYQDYLNLANKKKAIIIEGNVKELERITQQEQDIIVNMGKIDQIRTAIVGNILHELDIEYIGNISDLSNYLEPLYKTKVVDLKNKLESLLREIQHLNELNAKLIHQSLDYIDFNMNVITSLDTAGSTYGDEANEKDLKKKSSIFDAKV